MALWISKAEVKALPGGTPGYNAVAAAATSAWPAPKIADQDNKADQYALAGALIQARTDDPQLYTKVMGCLKAVQGTEAGARTLAIGRNLLGYVIAADLIGYREAGFITWLTKCLNATFDGMTLKQCHERRANNWGTHAGSSRLAASLYLNDTTDVNRAVTVWKGWLGDRNAYAGFKYGGTEWQADPAKPVGINGIGTQKQGHPVDGVLPDDQRRAGGFTWPPPAENYVRGALGGVLCALELARRNGFPELVGYQSSAARRAIEWFLTYPKGTYGGDDAWQPYLARKLYPGLTVPGGDPKCIGKHMSWTAFTCG